MRLLAINLLLSAALLVAPWVGILIGDPARSARGGAWARAGAHAGMFLVYLSTAVLLLFGLTWIEYRGIRFFAARRAWRLTPEAAWQVCGHASVGWILSGFLPMWMLAVLQALVVFFGYTPGGELDLTPVVPVPIRIQEIARGLVIFGGFLTGLLEFEVLVYVGVRKCRYATTIAPRREPRAGATPQHP